MFNTKSFDQSELIRLAIVGIDTQIAELQGKRAQLAAMTNEQPSTSTVKAVTPLQKKTGKMSEEARAKISAAATARWAKVKKAKAEAAKTAAAKKAPSKKTSVKTQTAAKKGKKSPAKKGKATPVVPVTETTSENAAS